RLGEVLAARARVSRVFVFAVIGAWEVNRIRLVRANEGDFATGIFKADPEAGRVARRFRAIVHFSRTYPHLTPGEINAIRQFGAELVLCRRPFQNQAGRVAEEAVVKSA